MALLTLSPPIATPVPANLGGTGVANAAASLLTLVGHSGLTDISAGGLAISGVLSGTTLNIGNGKTPTLAASLTFAGTDGKTLTIDNTLELAGTDSTTMTFPASSTTVAGLSIAQTFTANQAITTSGTGGPLLITANGLSTFDHGVLKLVMGSSGFSNPIFWVDTSVSFPSGWLAYLAVSGSAKFQVMADGSTILNGGLAVGGGSTVAGSISVNSNRMSDTVGRLYVANLGTGAATGTATLGRIPTGQTTTAMSGWFAISVAGTVSRVPFWNNT